MDTINYSIIIPHKNIPILLTRLLKSIPKRDDLEVIVVDDNSSEEFVNFTAFPGTERKDVKVFFDKSDKGAGHARNIGLENATGKFILFADADDMFNYCLDDILNEYSSSDFDLIYFKSNSLDSDTYENGHRTDYYINLIDNYLKQSNKYESLLRFRNGVVWGKIFRMDMIKKNHIWFRELSAFNDMSFADHASYYAQKIKADERAIYCTTERKGSITYSHWNERKQIDRIKALAERKAFFKKHGIIVPEDRHIKFLLECKQFSEATYKEALQILNESGITEKEIESQIKMRNRNKKINRIKEIVYLLTPPILIKQIQKLK